MSYLADEEKKMKSTKGIHETKRQGGGGGSYFDCRCNLFRMTLHY
jgi:hypothetical protein